MNRCSLHVRLLSPHLDRQESTTSPAFPEHEALPRLLRAGYGDRLRVSPTKTPGDERVGRDWKGVMTYFALLGKDKKLDIAFRTCKTTEKGAYTTLEIYSHFASLRMTTMGAEEVFWFARETSISRTQLQKTWDDATS